MRHRNAFHGLACVLSLTAAGCFKTTAPDQPNQDSVEDPFKPPRTTRIPDVMVRAPGEDMPERSTPSDGFSEPIERCIRGGYCVDVTPVEAADLLFVVDNSGSMRQEQAALREQFPKLITALATGTTSAGNRFPAVRDLHLGVVSTDMGLAGIANNFPGCNTQRHINGGDDGLLQHPGNTGPNCAAMYPPFLSFRSDTSEPQTLAQDFSCIAALGTSGCGFEQPLEAALKALWPKYYSDAAGNMAASNPILFLSTTNEGRFGHGDVPIAEGGNGGFLRKHPGTLLGIVVVTDEEDCSAKNTSHFISTNDPNNPLYKQGINLRCFYNKQNLFELERYVKGFQALKPGREHEVVFAAIVGVPAELTTAEFRAEFDFSDPASRDKYYDQLLNDTRMIERPMNEQVPAIANVAPSCSRTDRFGERADAYPPRRIVEVARGMGEHAIVQSICQDDFGLAIDGILELLRTGARAKCLPTALKRSERGRVSCDVLWELPGNGIPPEGVPVQCYERKFLSEVTKPRDALNERGGKICKVAQLSVEDGAPGRGEGFYYDDFSDEFHTLCGENGAARIAFSPGAQPPNGVRVVLDCAR